MLLLIHIRNLSIVFKKNIGRVAPLLAYLENSCSASEAVGEIVWKEIKKTAEAMRKK